MLEVFGRGPCPTSLYTFECNFWILYFVTLSCTYRSSRVKKSQATSITSNYKNQFINGYKRTYVYKQVYATDTYWEIIVGVTFMYWET